MKLLLTALSILMVSCGTAVTSEPSVVVPATPSPVIITLVITATPTATIQPTPTVQPTPTAEPTPTVEAVAVPIPVVLPTPTVAPTSTPQPTATPWVIERTVTVLQTVEVEVTVVVTATPTPIPTRTPTPTPTPTSTPVPTATAIPPFIQGSSGKGSWLSSGFNFWSERPIEISIVTTGTGLFALSAVTPNGCVITLSSGVAPYTATTLAEPNAPSACDGMHEFGNGTRLTVVAGGSVSWSVDLTQYSQPVPQNPPASIDGIGQNIFGPLRLGQGEILEVISDGDTPFRLDVYSLYESDPVVARVIDVPGSAFGTWFIGVPLGAYMIAIDVEQGRSWTVGIRYP